MTRPCRDDSRCVDDYIRCDMTIRCLINTIERTAAAEAISSNCVGTRSGERQQQVRVFVSPPRKIPLPFRRQQLKINLFQAAARVGPPGRSSNLQKIKPDSGGSSRSRLAAVQALVSGGAGPGRRRRRPAAEGDSGAALGGGRG